MKYNFKPKKCKYCGNIFSPKAGNQTTCENEECNKKRIADYRKNHTQQKKQTNVIMPTLSEMSGEELLHYGKVQSAVYSKRTIKGI